MVSRTIDAVISEVYVLIDVPADRVVADTQLASRFLDEVNSRLDVSERLDQAAFNSLLINLRRRGEAKGGLPRIRHAYFGRAQRNAN